MNFDIWKRLWAVLLNFNFWSRPWLGGAYRRSLFSSHGVF